MKSISGTYAMVHRNRKFAANLMMSLSILRLSLPSSLMKISDDSVVKCGTAAPPLLLSFVVCRLHATFSSPS